MNGDDAIRLIEANSPCSVKGLNILRLDGKHLHKPAAHKREWLTMRVGFVIGAVLGLSVGIIVSVILLP